MIGWYRATNSVQRGESASAPMAFSKVVEVVIMAFLIFAFSISEVNAEGGGTAFSTFFGLGRR
ncbi:MAG: hypothetical protein J6U17_02465 [Kiritimatiellae bacterium]|nr:hypothetical protein [Kiritimatiellia bacterium]